MTRSVVAFCEPGLKDLHRAVKGQRGSELLADFLTRSQSCAELQAIWDAQLTVGRTYMSGMYAAGLSTRS